MTSPWLDSTPPPDVTALGDADLCALWHANRNSLLGTMAAEECTKRFERLTKEKENGNGA